MATQEHDPTPPYVLRFISGKYQGREFPLEMDRELLIGRLADTGLALVLADDTVSRKHAKIRTFGKEIAIDDLGSRTGTFVNGQQIASAPLKDGDEIRIGTSLIKLVGAPQPETERLMSGSLRVIPLPDLIQLLTGAHKSGVLTIHGEHGVGRIYLRDGKVCHAKIEGSALARPRKAFYRILRWTSGTFDLAPYDGRPVGEEIPETTVALMLEGMVQVDELPRLEKDLPSPEAQLIAVAPLPGEIKELSSEELTIFQLVLHHRTLQSVLDHYPGTDLEACSQMLALIKRGYIAKA